MGRHSLIDKKYILELLDSGMPVKEVASRTGYAWQTIYATMYSYRGHLGARKDKEKRDKIVSMYKQNMRQTEIAKEIGVSRQRIHQIIQEETKE